MNKNTTYIQTAEIFARRIQIAKKKNVPEEIKASYRYFKNVSALHEQTAGYPIYWQIENGKINIVAIDGEKLIVLN